MGKLVSIFFPVRKGIKKIKNKNIKPITTHKYYNLDINCSEDLEILQKFI